MPGDGLLGNLSKALPPSMLAPKHAPTIGPRHNNQGMKQSGYYGNVPLGGEGSDVATEYSVGVEPQEMGLTPQDMEVIREVLGWAQNPDTMEIPSLVPELLPEEFSLLQRMASGSDEQIPESLMAKIKNHARQRLMEGRDPFWTEGEEQFFPPDYQTTPEENDEEGYYA